MRVGIDCRVLMSWGAGVRNYVSNLVDALARIDHENEYVLYYNYFLSHGWKPFVPSGGNFRLGRNPIPLSLYRSLRYFIPPWFFTGVIDVFHAPAFFFDDYVVSKAPPVVITIHDLGYERFPNTQTPDFIDNYRRELASAIDYAEAVITISNSTAMDVAELYPQAEDKIITIYLAVEERFFNVRETPPFDFPYFLFVSTIEPRKNVEFLLRVYSKVLHECKAPHKLVLVGAQGRLSGPIYKTVERLHLKDDIVFTGSVHAESLPAYYGNATLFLFPSLYEGFGLPPVEAQAAGIPVLASDVSSLPEVLGEGAILLPPDDADAWAEAVTGLLSNDERRAALAEMGRENARRFSWSKTARETRDVYRLVGERSG
jgi:glycosyltransferase involved in cell wall biosynthesis